MHLPRSFVTPAAVLLSALACAAGRAQSPHQPSLAPPPVLRAFDVSAATMQKLTVPDPLATGVAAPFSVALNLGGRVVSFDLVPVDLRAPGFQLWLQTPGGLAPMPAGPCTTYRGCPSDNADDCMAASVYGGQLRAVIRLAGDVWSVQPLADAVSGLAPDATTHVVFRGADSGRPGVRCGNTALSAPPSTGGFFDSVYECELALEADLALFQANNNNALATQAEVLGVVNAVDLIYQSDLDVSYSVTQLVVDALWDPYTSDVAATLLDQMRVFWNASYASLPRDVAHLFTGRSVGAASNGAVGIAYTATACSVASAYGLSQTRWTPNMSLRVALTAHELGHNFGADHCDLQPGCGIMCSDIGSCSGAATTFGPTALAEMNVHLQSVGCLTVVPTVPVLTGASPALVPNVDPPLVTLNGSGFLGVTDVRVGGVSSASVQVLSDSLLVFEPPEALPLGLQTATASNAAGTSNATVMLMQAANPCRLSVEPLGSIGAPFTWLAGGQPNDFAVVLVSFFPSTTPMFGGALLDQSLILFAGQLGANGTASFTVPAIPYLLPSYTFYSQVLEQQVSGAVSSLSKIKGTDVQ